jgi:hypothetical protein
MLPVVATPLPEMLPLKLLTFNDVTGVATFPTYTSFAHSFNPAYSGLFRPIENLSPRPQLGMRICVRL